MCHGSFPCDTTHLSHFSDTLDTFLGTDSADDKVDRKEEGEGGTMTWQEFWLASGVSVLQCVAAVCCSVLQCVAAQS